MSNYEDLRAGVEEVSHGTNVVIMDDVGMPSIMVKIPKMNCKDLFEGGDDKTHAGFIVDGVEHDYACFSKYVNIVENDRAYSLPFKDPRVNVNFTQSNTYCRNKGDGWGLLPRSLWTAVSLWCLKNNKIPSGNTWYGSYDGDNKQTGVSVGLSSFYNFGWRTLAGSGPLEWSHDRTEYGITDMTGNVWKWTGGQRLNNREINIIPNADSVNTHSLTTDNWKAIMPDGELVDPGTKGTLKIDFRDGKAVVATEIKDYLTTGDYEMDFRYLTMADDLVAPNILKELGLFPTSNIGRMGRWYLNHGSGEYIFHCGARWNFGSSCGPFAMFLRFGRSNSWDVLGFVSAYYGNC